MSVSDTSHGSDAPRADIVMFGLVLLAGLALLFYFSAQRQTELRKSAVGFEGLQVWLTAEGHRARSFTGGWPIDPDPIGLLVQPIFDPRPDHSREPPQTKEALLMQEEEFDQWVFTVLAKSRKATSLVILPKWRSGLRLTGIAHPILLDRADGPRDIVGHLLDEDGVRLSHLPEPFVDFDYTAVGETLTARLYVPQVFASTKCSPIIGTNEAMVLAKCDDQGHELYVLSDPDLFNNHGLRLADNAAIASHFLADVAGGKDLLIDYSTRDWFASGSAPDTYERSWEDFKRFFGEPFLALWLAGAFTLALVLWRAGRRDGPLIASAEGPGSAKALAIQARARLMRLTDQDGALVGDYAKARLAALAANLYGPAHGMDARSLDRQLAATFPAQHAELTQALAGLRALPAKTAAVDAFAQVNALEQILEKMHHEPR